MSIAQRRDFVQRIPWQIFASRWYISCGQRCPRTARRMRALLTYESAKSQLSKLWCGRFVRIAAVSILRVEAGDSRVSVVLCHDVHWQQALSALRCVGNSARAGRAVSNALPAMQSGYVIGADRNSDYARVRKVRRGLAGCGGP